MNSYFFVPVHTFFRLFSFALSGLHSVCCNLSGGLRHPAMRSFGPSARIKKNSVNDYRLRKVDFHAIISAKAGEQSEKDGFLPAQE